MKILIWTFVIFFTVAWVAMKVEDKYFPIDTTFYVEA
jgi:hypothetical protein